MNKSTIGSAATLKPLIRCMEVGQSISLVRELDLTDPQAATKMVRAVSAQVAQLNLGYTFKYESFTALTSKQLPVVGCVATRVS